MKWVVEFFQQKGKRHIVEAECGDEAIKNACSIANIDYDDPKVSKACSFMHIKTEEDLKYFLGY